MALQLFLTVAFSAAPLTLYIPPVRSLTLFVEFFEELRRETAPHCERARRTLLLAFSRLLPALPGPRS